jgi:hypothetical protein
MYGMDYQKAFRTMPHSLIKSVKLDKKKQALNQENHKPLE